MNMAYLSFIGNTRRWHSILASYTEHANQLLITCPLRQAQKLSYPPHSSSRFSDSQTSQPTLQMPRTPGEFTDLQYNWFHRSLRPPNTAALPMPKPLLSTDYHHIYKSAPSQDTAAPRIVGSIPHNHIPLYNETGRVQYTAPQNQSSDIHIHWHEKIYNSSRNFSPLQIDKHWKVYTNG